MDTLKYIMQGVVLSFALCTPLFAHSLKLFVQEEAHKISGQVYFSGGVAAQRAAVTLRDKHNHVLNQAVADDNGNFQFLAPTEGAALVVANAHDGHVARWPLTGRVTKPVAPQTLPHPVAVPSCESLESGVRQVITEEISQLRLALQHQQDRVRLTSFLGGIGFFFGLAGLYLWWQSRP